MVNSYNLNKRIDQVQFVSTILQMRQVIQGFYDLVLADAMRIPSRPDTPKRPPTTPGKRYRSASTDSERSNQSLAPKKRKGRSGDGSLDRSDKVGGRGEGGSAEHPDVDAFGPSGEDIEPPSSSAPSSDLKTPSPASIRNTGLERPCPKDRETLEENWFERRLREGMEYELVTFSNL